MKIKFNDLDSDTEHTAVRWGDCRNDVERELWKMHEAMPDCCWKLGKTIAEKLND